MKKCVAAVLAVILTISLTSCGMRTNHDAYEEIYKRYNKMTSFYAYVKVTAVNERTKNIYLAKQFFSAPDKYCVQFEEPEDIAGSGYIFKDGELVLVSGFGKAEKIDAEYREVDSTTFIVDFLEEYYNSEESFVSTSKDIESEITVLNRYTGEKDRNCFSQRLSFDNNTYLPIKLETFDVEGNLAVMVEFKEFKRDCDIDKHIFGDENK